MDSISIQQLRNQAPDTAFNDSYTSLVLGMTEDLSEENRITLLKWAIIFLNQKDDDIQKLGYRIILRYTNLFNDAQPLYEVSLAKGFVPIAKLIEHKNFLERPASILVQELRHVLMERYKQRPNVYLTQGQAALMHFGRTNDNALVVAPTSYGKSDIIISKVRDSLGKRTCILVPSKALIAQTKRRLLSDQSIAKYEQRIITHPDMFRGHEGHFIAVLTQERLLRILQQHPFLSLDLLLVDEAQNLLGNDDRNILLIQVILIALKRNPALLTNFFSPFISSHESIQSPYANYSLKSKHVNEQIKVERFYCYSVETKRLDIYDQFLDKFIPQETLSCDDFGFIRSKMASKNIIYLNKPRHIESVALKLSESPQDTSLSAKISKACQAITDYLHEDYNLLSCIKSGVVYHHGRMPEVIRLYVEDLFSKTKSINHIVTNSTLLEGVNIPAEKIFLLSVGKGGGYLSRSEFRNLIGRVCRFNEIFAADTGSLKMLEPEIYILDGGYQKSNFNMETFVRDKAKVNLKATDEVTNILLKPAVTEEDRLDSKRAIETLENIERHTVSVPEISVRYVESELAKLCFKHNIFEFDVHTFESQLNDNLKNASISEPLTDAGTLIDAISAIFLRNIAHIGNDDFGRLRLEPARKFYSMFLKWRMDGSSYQQIIKYYLGYWQSIEKPQQLIYVGHTWGDKKKDDAEFVEAYVDISEKTKAERVNLAIVKIKDEQDFIEYKLIKYIEILNDLGMLESSLYDRVKYGSSNKKIICLLKNGFSMELAKCLVETYHSYVEFDLPNDGFSIKNALIDKMVENQENNILIFEAQYHL